MLKYTQKKLKNQVFANLIIPYLSDSMAERVRTCGGFLEMLADLTLEKKKVHKGNFCKNRFCPMCAWRQARRDALKIGTIMAWLATDYEKQFIFVTLTTPNVPAAELPAEIDHFNKAFQRMAKRKEILALSEGYVRKLELTYNAKRNDYNPHFHVIFAVNKSYFASRNYLKQARWLEIWREVTGDDSITQVRVQKLKDADGKGAAEMAAYAAKDSEYLQNDNVFKVFYTALKGRQVLTYNGLFADGNKLFKKHELDGFRETDPTEYIYRILYRWGMGEYVEAERNELTEDEKQTLNKRLIEDAEVDE